MKGDKPAGSSVNVDLGVKAELKATVPEKSAGRFLDAITDLIRPLSEWTGFKADQMRLRREDVMFEIAKKAHARLQIENAEVVPVPLKFLVPYIENASNEEPDSELVDWWANLLVSAAQGEHRHPVLVDIMSKITATEAQYLVTLWHGMESAAKQFKPATADVLEFFFSHIAERAYAEAIPSMEGSKFAEASKKITLDICELAKTKGIFPRLLQYPTDKHFGGRAEFDEESNALVDTCVAAGVLERISVNVIVPSPFMSAASASIDCVVFSRGGLELMQAVHRQA